MMLAGSGFQPLFTAALMQQFPTLQQFQSQLAHLQQQQRSAAALAAASAASTPHIPSAATPVRKTRVGGSSVKTAKVWKYFDQLPAEEQAAECQLCRKKIKATNSSTTGMIRHLRSCHVAEYQQLQEARQSSMLMKMEISEEKTRAHLLREMNEKVTGQVQAHVNRKETCQQKSPSSCSSASDTASSVAVSLDSSPLFMSGPNMLLQQMHPMNMQQPSSAHSHSVHSLGLSIPCGLPAPKPLLPHQQPVKMDMTEAEEEEEQLTELSTKACSPSDGPTAFSVVGGLLGHTQLSERSTEKSSNLYVNASVDEEKLNAQIAMMLLLDGQPAQTVDRPGFRGLVKLLIPLYMLPTSEKFETEIIPHTIAQLRQDINSQFLLNNPHHVPLAMSNMAMEQKHEESGIEVDVVKSSSPMSVNFMERIKVDEDSDCSSSAESERLMEEYCRDRDAGKRESIVSILQLCRTLAVHFASEPLPDLRPPAPSDPHGTPDFKQDVAFVTNNMEVINNYLASHPVADIQQVPEQEQAILRELHKQLQTTVSRD